MNFCRHLAEAAIANPDALAVAVQKCRYRRLSYDEIDFLHLHQESDVIAQALTDQGIKAGMKAVLMVTPSIEFFALTFALFKAGIIPIFVDPGLGIKNLKQCFVESAPDAFIGIAKAHLARKIFSWGKQSLRFIVTVGSGNLLGGIKLTKLIKQTKNRYTLPLSYPMVQLAAHDLAAILFTSGSTGTPKGVVYSHTMFEAQIQVLKEDYDIRPGERDLATFPLFSLFGPALSMAAIVPAMNASKPITANPDRLFAAINHYQCSNMFANPALIERLGAAGVAKKQALPSIKRVISAGAPVTISAVARFSKMLNTDVEVINSYGATESLPLAKMGSKALLKTAMITDHGGGTCVGLPVTGVDVTIISITDDVISTWSDDLALPANHIGEIVVKGDMVSQGYYQRQQANLAAKIADGNVVRHRMGDLGYLDDLGQLWMCGRKNHRVVTEDQVYYSISCERIFNVHPDIKRSALVSVMKAGKIQPLLCIELASGVKFAKFGVARTRKVERLFNELTVLGDQHPVSKGIVDFLIHPNFPVDIRHNAKIFREKLAHWAQKKLEGQGK